jgi:zinc protease
MHTDFATNEVVVRVRFGGGRRQVAPGDLITAAFAVTVARRGGLARNSYQDMEDFFADEDVPFDMQMLGDAFVMRSTTTPGALGDVLQILAAYATEPAFNNLDNLIPTARGAALRAVRAAPLFMLNALLTDGVAPGNPNGLQALENAPPIRAADMARVLKPALTEAPLELTIVGNVDEAAAVKAVAATFGALPARSNPPPPRPDAWFLRFPVNPPPLISGFHDGPQEKAAVGLVWPLYVAELSRRREELSLKLVALVYQEALLRRIRGDLSKVYSPAADTQMPDLADQGFLLAEVETTPADVDLVRREMADIAAKIGRGEFTDEDLDIARKPYLARLAAAAKTNVWWAEVLDASFSDPAFLPDELQRQATIASIAPAEVRKAAANWLARTPIAIVVTPQPATAAAPAGRP